MKKQLLIMAVVVSGFVALAATTSPSSAADNIAVRGDLTSDEVMIGDQELTVSGQPANSEIRSHSEEFIGNEAQTDRLGKSSPAGQVLRAAKSENVTAMVEKRDQLDACSPPGCGCAHFYHTLDCINGGSCFYQRDCCPECGPWYLSGSTCNGPCPDPGP